MFSTVTKGTVSKLLYCADEVQVDTWIELDVSGNILHLEKIEPDPDNELYIRAFPMNMGGAYITLAMSRGIKILKPLKNLLSEL